MKQYALLRLLFAGFLLYFALPYIPQAITLAENVFWGSWLTFLMLVIGSNLATLLHISKEPIMEQKESERERSSG